jgi:hypothetical protein
MTRFLDQLFLCTLIGIAGATCASAQGQAEAHYSYAGTVINTATGEAVKRAQIQIRRFSRFDPNQPGGNPAGPEQVAPLSVAAFSDAAGMFRFEGLPAGSYFVNVTKPGFTFERNFDKHASGMLTLNSSVEGASLRLSPLGVIQGKVTGDDGLPLRHVNIVALTVQIIDGLRHVSASRNVSTDDRGLYRLWNLSPGKYYLKASGRSGGTITYAGDRPPISSEYESFTPVYFGGASSLMSATPILIKAGSDEQADITLTMSPSFRIRGRLLNLAQGEPVRFELLNGDEEVGASRVSVNQYSGAFQIHDVVHGSYILRATQGKTARGEVPVGVGAADLDGVALTLAPAVNVKVVTLVANKYEDVLRAQGLEAEDSGGDLQGAADLSMPPHGRLQAPAPPCAPSLQPVGTQSRQSEITPTQANATNGEDGAITFKEVLPGTYRLSFNCYAGYVASVQWAGNDLLTDLLLTLQPGIDPAPVEVTARFGGGALSGDLKLGDSANVEQAGILLVPQFTSATGPVTATATKPAPSTSEPPVFEFANLAPGHYLAYAFANLSEVEFRNPEYLRSLTGGTSVEIADGKQANITLTDLVR